MNANTQTASRQRFVAPFTLLVVAAGSAACVYSVCRLPVARLDARALILALVTLGFGSRLTLSVPRAKVQLSFSDSLIFLAMLLYGGEVAVLLAGAEALCTSWRFSKRGVTIRADGIAFNSALMACSTGLSSLALSLGLGPITELSHSASSSTFIIAVCLMALVQYAANSSLAAVYTACESNQPIWSTWNNHYFSSSVTYAVGAATAGLLVKLIGGVGAHIVIAAAPIIGLVYLAHRRYIDDIRASAAQAERAEHARAEAERMRAEQAERYVEELNHYVAELERTSRALEESHEHFRYAAFHDPLTDLPNRAFFTEQLRLAAERGRRHQRYSFAVLFLDLDRFKIINDSLGHGCGDQLLVAISRRLEATLRQTDTIARFGGDEFAILLDGLRHSGEAIRVAEKIQRALAQPFNLYGHEAFTTASIGIALGADGYERPEDILRDADAAMYRAKENGKARYELFDKTLHTRAVSLLRLENDLRRAIERKEFRVYYQPIVHLGTGKLHGFEALVRWQHPERGLVLPADFIPVAEETGLISPIGMWVLEESCQQMRRWHQQTLSNRLLALSVNLSGRQLSQPDLIEKVAAVLQKTGLDPRSLKLEITESEVMENAEAAAVKLQQLRSLGPQLGIDDFGTGYSSLSYLHRFPLNTLKIDRSFVNRIEQGGENLEIVRTIVTLARNLGMEAVAEGVETEGQLAQLCKLGCEYGQGYLFAHPLDCQTAEGLIRRGRLAATTGPLMFDISGRQEPELLGNALVM
jgi:diguanylate cyclase (GGDEF)-like protein